MVYAVSKFKTWRKADSVLVPVSVHYGRAACVPLHRPLDHGVAGDGWQAGNALPHPEQGIFLCEL